MKMVYDLDGYEEYLEEIPNVKILKIIKIVENFILLENDIWIKKQKNDYLDERGNIWKKASLVEIDYDFESQEYYLFDRLKTLGFYKVEKNE